MSRSIHSFFTLMIPFLIPHFVVAGDLQPVDAFNLVQGWDGYSAPLLQAGEMLSCADMAIVYAREHQPRLAARLFKKKATLLRSQRRLTESLEAIQEAFRLSPDDVSISSAFHLSRFMMAIEPDVSADEMIRIYKSNPTSTDAALAFATMAYKRKQYVVASHSALKVLKEQPRNHHAAIIFGESTRSSRPKQVLQVLSEALANGRGVHEGEYSQLLSIQGATMLSTGDARVAQQLLSGAWRLGYKTPASFINTHNSMVFNGDYSSARALIAFADSKLVSDDRVKVLHAMHLTDIGEYESARKTLDSVATDDPEAKDIAVLAKCQLSLRTGNFKDAAILCDSTQVQLASVRYQLSMLKCLMSQTAKMVPLSQDELLERIDEFNEGKCKDSEGRNRKISLGNDALIQIAVLKASIGRWGEAIRDLRLNDELVAKSGEKQNNQGLIELFSKRVKYDLTNPECRAAWTPTVFHPIVVFPLVEDGGE